MKMKNRTLQLLALGAMALAGGALAVHAQTYSIDWYTVAGGGGTSMAGVYSVTGTIGQHDAAGPMTCGNYSLTSGHWSLVAVSQSPGTPKLTIWRSGNSVTISWPSPSTGFVLQQNANVANPNGWSAFGGTVSDNGTIRSVTINAPAGNLFFRLRSQQ
jgi:hypothetical protein